MYSHVTTLTFTVTFEKIELLKGHLLSFVVSYHLFVFFNNANTVSAEMWVWCFGNHAWYKSLVKSLVFDSWLETFVSLVISKTPYSHFLLTVFSQCCSLQSSIHIMRPNVECSRIYPFKKWQDFVYRPKMAIFDPEGRNVGWRVATPTKYFNT